MIKAVFFDLDGTILDTIDTYWQAFNAAVATFQLEAVSRKVLLPLMGLGYSLPEILCEIYPEVDFKPESAMLEGVRAEIRNAYLMHGGAKVELTSGAQELFGLLRERELKIGIVTSRSVTAERQWHELEKLQMAHFIDVVITGAEARRKPAPDTVIECLQKMGLSPEEAIFVGDSQADIIAAKAAGMKVVAVTTGVSDNQALLEESPDFIFDDLPELIVKLDSVLGSTG